MIIVIVLIVFSFFLFFFFLIIFSVCSYETGNNIKADETGTLKKATSPDSNDAIIAQGGFTYTSPEGQVISIRYVADDVGGFQPQVCRLNSTLNI